MNELVTVLVATSLAAVLMFCAGVGLGVLIAFRLELPPHQPSCECRACGFVRGGDL